MNLVDFHHPDKPDQINHGRLHHESFLVEFIILNLARTYIVLWSFYINCLEYYDSL